MLDDIVMSWLEMTDIDSYHELEIAFAITFSAILLLSSN